MSKVHALSGIIGERHRQVITAVVDQITASPGEAYGLQLMPPVNYPASILIHEVVSGFGGLTGERALDEKGKAIVGGDSETRFFKPGAYQEHRKYTEQDLLMLRRLGSIGDRGVTGLTSGELDWLTRDTQKLELRLKNRLQKLAWDALFTGQWSWKGQLVDFAIPGGNALSAATDWSVAATGTPLADLWAIQTTNALVMKYVVKEYVINPKTAADIMKTAEVREVLKNYNIVNNDINVVAKFLYPGLAPIKIVKDAYQDETVSGGKAVLGNTTYFVPNDKVLVVPDFSGKLYGLYGEIQITENLNGPGASVQAPAQGIYTFIDEKGLEEREAPFIKVVAGFNGGPNLMRRDDVITISV
jgi:hypothetical protein